MAGIGFELHKMLRQESLFGLLRAYGFAGIISSGPWIMSMLGMTLVQVLWKLSGRSDLAMVQFQVSVTYLISLSLILTGLLQILLSRFLSDRIFEERHDRILPNLLGAIALVTLCSGLLGSAAVIFLFSGPVGYRVLLLANFVTLCDMWIVVVLLSGMRAVRSILLAFLFGYGITALSTLSLRSLELDGLLTGFLLGHGTLLFSLLALVVRTHPSRQLLAFEFLDRRRAFFSLAATGFLYNLAIWADKFVFWFHPGTSTAVLGPLRASLIYDMPASLSYFSIIPGMAVFIMRIETDFVTCYDRFYQALRNHDTLDHIAELKGDMIRAIKQGLHEVLKVQGLAVIGFVLCTPAILELFHGSAAYVYLLCIDVLAVGIQVLFLCVLNVFFYFDERRAGLLLCALYAVLNIALSLLSQRLGPYFYGYGPAVTVAVTSLVGLSVLTRKLGRLEYRTFVLH